MHTFNLYGLYGLLWQLINIIFLKIHKIIKLMLELNNNSYEITQYNDKLTFEIKKNVRKCGNCMFQVFICSYVAHAVAILLDCNRLLFTNVYNFSDQFIDRNLKNDVLLSFLFIKDVRFALISNHISHFVQKGTFFGKQCLSDAIFSSNLCFYIET